MALGKQAGEFSLKATSFTVSPGPGKVRSTQANFEGPIKGNVGQGVEIGTLTVIGEPGAKSGTWSWCGTVALATGGSYGDQGQGSWEEIGPHRWRLRGAGSTDQGQSFAVEAEGNLAERALVGKLYEWA